MGFEGFPLIVGWELTLLCNLRCAHCGSSAGQPRCNELTTREALDLCEQLPALLVQEVDFTGGEPLLRPDWPDLAARLVELGISVNILTNGSAVGTDTIIRMKDSGISVVGISLDGTESTHDYVRARKGSFQDVLRTIAALQSANLPFNVITAVNALNLSELPRMADLLVSIGVTSWRLQPVIHMGRVQDHPELHIDDTTVRRLGEFVREHHRGPNALSLELLCGDGLEYVEDEDPEVRPWRGCSAGISACGITSDGKVKGCLSLPQEFAEGDLRERSLWDIWFDERAFPYTRGFNLSGLGPFCAGCDKGEACKGGCTSSSYCATGQVHNDPFCYLRASGRRTPAFA
jgi:radical SAM protein with 4Fe4S-binding SPASM domain